MLLSAEKNWDDYVACAEEVARGPGFQRLRDEILERAALGSDDVVVDLGSGTGLLTLPAAEQAQRVWAIDISAAMAHYLEAKAQSAGLENVEAVVGSIVSVPVVDASIDVAISNYCFHHLSQREKLVALREVERILVPGGRLVVADMMFSLALADDRNRAVVKAKVRSMLKKGPAGAWRLARNGVRYLTRRWEQPATAEWWSQALADTGFREVEVLPLEHEGGIATARKSG